MLSIIVVPYIEIMHIVKSTKGIDVQKYLLYLLFEADNTNLTGDNEVNIMIVNTCIVDWREMEWMKPAKK